MGVKFDQIWITKLAFLKADLLIWEHVVHIIAPVLLIRIISLLLYHPLVTPVGRSIVVSRSLLLLLLPVVLLVLLWLLLQVLVSLVEVGKPGLLCLLGSHKLVQSLVVLLVRLALLLAKLDKELKT